MSDRNDIQGIALAMAMMAAGLVVAGVVALAVSGRQQRPDAGAATMGAAEDLGPVERIEFEPGSAALPPDAKDALERATEAARMDSGLSVLVVPLCAANADASAAALTDLRGHTVRHALEANGLSPQRVILTRPAPVTGRAVDWVEVRLQ